MSLTEQQMHLNYNCLQHQHETEQLVRHKTSAVAGNIFINYNHTRTRVKYRVPTQMT